MSKIHKIKRRIKSVNKISQITKAMEKVAASKRRRAQEATLRSRAYALSAREALAHLYILTGAQQHPLFAHRPLKNRLVILLSSDRGLAGPFNSNLFRAFIQQVKASTNPLKVIVIGERGTQFISRLGKVVDVVGVYTNWPASPTSTDVQPIAETALKLFSEGTVDDVDLLYTDFVSTMRQKITERQLLPIDPAFVVQPGSRIGTKVKQALFEPSSEEVLEFIVPRLIEVQIYQASLESIASEQTMRMVAMKNASDNAEDITEDLTLTYNGARQAAITQELAEISAGAAAI